MSETSPTAALNGLVSWLPVVGAAKDGYNAAQQGDAMEAAFCFGSAALELCGVMGAVGVGPLSLTTVTAAANLRSASSCTARHACATSRSVIKHNLKKKAGARTRQAVGKIAVAGVGAVAEAKLTRKVRHRLAALGSKALPQAAASLADIVSNPELRVFHEEASCDARLHAVLAFQVYSPPAERRGVPWSSGDGVWYAYVGGDARRGFWYTPQSVTGERHMVMAERGTQDMLDLGTDALIGIGLGASAVQDRVEAARRALQEQLRCHPSDRMSVTGHSLGGAIAVEVACRASGRVVPGFGGGPDGAAVTVHAFNPGGLPDLRRTLSWSCSAAEVHLHRIDGDVISVGFASPWSVRCYSTRPDIAEVSPHAMVHFIPRTTKTKAIAVGAD